MALVLRDRVKETTSTAGTGTYSLAGAVDGFESFGSVGDGNTTYYGCSDGINFEVGIGTYTASGTTLARTTILQSSNSDNAVNWGTGTRTIFCTLPAEKMSFLDASGNLVAANGSALTNLNGSNISSGTVPVARIDTGTTAGKIIVLDGSARLPAVDGSQLFNVATGPADITADSFTGNNSTTAFTITTAPAAADDLLVTINGLIQRPTTDYTVSGTTLTFTSVPFTGANIFSRLIGGSESTNGDLLAANNLSDLDNAATARTNLGLGTAATTASTDYATAAQGTTADAALPRTGGAMTGAITTNSTFDGRDVATDGAKLDGIEAGANVTDATNVAAAGALMDSEVTNLAQVKAFDSSDYATAAQGTTADAALPRSGGAMTGAITTNSTFDGRNVSVDGAKLDGIAAGATAYSDSDVDTHLNTSTASASEVLSWTGTDYDWVAQSGGGGGASTEIPILAKTASYTVVAGDAGKIVSFSGGAYTATLTAAATLGSGFFCFIENNAAINQATHTVTIDPNGSETIDGRTTFIVRQGERVQLVCDGSNFKLISSFHRGIATNMTTDFFNLPQALGDESVAIGLGTIAGVGNTSNAVAIGTNAQAGSSATAIGGGTNAGSSQSTALGKNSGGGGSVATSGTAAMALGGSRASGTDSLAAAITNNTSSYGASGNNSIAIGYRAKATHTGATSIGYQTQATAQETQAIGSYAIASGLRSSAFGYQAQTISSPQYSIVLGPNSNANANNTTALGYQAQASTVIGRHGYGNGNFAASGDSQHGLFILRSDTTDATAEALTTNNSTASTNNQLLLPNNSAYSFLGTIVARESAASGSDYASWEIKGALLRDANAASTVLGNGIQNKLYATAGASAWAIALTADTTNGGLKIEVTGAASTNIRWVATVHTSEVTYA